MIAGALLHEAWRWFARMGAPIVAAFIVGWVWRGAHEQIDALKTERASLIAEKAAAVTEIDSAMREKVEALDRERKAETLILSERERFYDVLAKLSKRAASCPATRADAADSLRVSEAAFRFAVGSVPGGTDGAEGGN